MRGTFAIFLLIVSLGAVESQAGRSSAYHRLRDQFSQARTPKVNDLYMGQIWHCSGSLKAAKGLFRYVDYWQAFYKFQSESDQEDILANKGPRGPRQFAFANGKLSGVKTSCVTCQRAEEFLRITDEGDLLVEVAFSAGTGPQFGAGNHRFLPAVSESQLVAQFYLICENPESHNDPEWYNREGEYWSE